MPTTHREPLCLSVGVTNIEERVLHVLNQHYLIFIALTGSCARPKSSRWLQLPLFQRVFAGCHRSLLEDAPSRCYLCNLCIGAWTLTPCWCPYSFLPKEHRPHVRSETFGTSGLPLQCSFYKARYFGAAVIPL